MNNKSNLKIFSIFQIILFLIFSIFLTSCANKEYEIIDVIIEKIYDGECVNPIIKTKSNSPYSISYRTLDSDEFIIDAPVNAGDYEAKITFYADEKYKEKTIYEQFSIKQRQLNLSGISIQNKIYDGSTNACILGTPQLDNIVEGDEVQIDGEIKAKFVSENKGSNIEVIFETINLIGKDKNNYKLVYPALSANIYGEEDLFIINYLVEGKGGSIHGNTSQLIEKNGNTQKVTAVSDEGYYFDKWSDGLTNPERYDTGIIKSFDIYAIFKQNINENELDLFIIAGQSNSVCYTGTDSAKLDILNSPDYPKRVYEYKSSLNNIQKLQNPIGEGVSLAGSAMGYTTGGTWFSSMAKAYIEETGRSVVILPAGNPGVTTNTFYNGSSNYIQLINKYTSFKNWIDSSSQYILGRIILVWHQGESGTGDSNSISVATKKVFDDISEGIASIDNNHPLDQVFFSRISINDACSLEDTKLRNKEFIKLNNETDYVLVAPNAMKYYWLDQFADVHHYDMNACNDFGDEIGNDIASYYLNNRNKPNIVTYEETQNMNYASKLLKGLTIQEDSLIAFKDTIDDELTWLLANSLYDSYAKFKQIELNLLSNFELSFSIKLGDKFGNTSLLPILGSEDGDSAIFIGENCVQFKSNNNVITLNHTISPIIKRISNNNTCKDIIHNTYKIVCQNGIVKLFVNNDEMSFVNITSNFDMSLNLFGKNMNTYLNGIVSNFELKIL